MVEVERGGVVLLGALIAFLFTACILGDRVDESRIRPLAGDLADQNWGVYLGDAARSHASPLDQIDRQNVAHLEVAWTYDTGPVESGLSQIQCNPIVVDGVLFGTTPRSHPFALDAATGEELWRFDPTAHGSAAQGHNRGVVHWAGPEGGRILADPDQQPLRAVVRFAISSFAVGRSEWRPIDGSVDRTNRTR